MCVHSVCFTITIRIRKKEPDETGSFLLSRDGVLPEKFRGNLDVARASRADHGIRGCDIRGVDHGSDSAGNREICVHREHVEVGVIENVEHLSAKLEADFFSELPRLGERHIPVRESRAAENVAAHIALRIQSRRSDYG